MTHQTVLDLLQCAAILALSVGLMLLARAIRMLAIRDLDPDQEP